MEEVLKVLGAIGAIFGFYKITVDVILAKANKHREEYQFAKDYIQDLSDPSVHNFVLEKGFRALSGNYYPIDEVKYLLSYREPTKAIMLRSSAKETIEFNYLESKYNWSGLFRNEWYRIVIPWLYLLLYFLFAFIVFYPLFNGESSSSISHIPIAIFAIYFAVKHSDFKESLLFMALQRHDGTNSDITTVNRP